MVLTLLLSFSSDSIDPLTYGVYNYANLTPILLYSDVRKRLFKTVIYILILLVFNLNGGLSGR